MEKQLIQEKQNHFLASYAPCQQRFVRYCSTLTYGKMSADDLIQDALLSAFENFDQIENKDQLLHYLIRSARNLSISKWRRDQFSSELLEKHRNQLISQGASADTLLDVKLLLQAMDKLPSKQADAIILFELMGFKIKEIAKIQQSTEGAVKTRISRGRQRLRSMMQEKEPAPLLVFLFDQLRDMPFSLSQKKSQSLLSMSPSSTLSFSSTLASSLAILLLLIGTCFFAFKEADNPSNSTFSYVSLLSPSSPEASLASDSLGFRCVIKGKTVGRNSQGLFLVKATDDPRAGIIIPVIDNKFDYTLHIEQVEAYKLVFIDEYERGSWYNIIFFPEEGETEFVLYARDSVEQNQIKGGRLDQQYQDFQTEYVHPFYERIRSISDELSFLRDQGEYYSEAGQRLSEKMDKAKGREWGRLRDQMTELEKQDHADKSLKAKILGRKKDAEYQAFYHSKVNYIQDNPSIVAYYLLYDDINWLDSRHIPLEEYRDNFALLSQRFPNHPYTGLIQRALNQHGAIQVGQQYIDIEAPNMEGEMIQLSSLIEGKIALLDLWASWCKPCIVESRKVIPVYEEFKDRGFTVVGIAREYRDTDAWKTALDREKYPWINLVDLDDKQSIWYTYDLSHAVGAIYLIDQQGKILAVDPSIDQVREMLEERL